MPYSAPASATDSQTDRPYQEETLISKASSPEKEIRQIRAGTPEARTVSRKAMNGNASLDRSSSGASFSTTARDFGPTTATVVYCSVTEVKVTSSSGHSVWDHSSSQSRTLAAPPVVVVMKYRSSSRRRVTPSSKTIPSGVHMTPYRPMPGLSFLKALV